jgi:methyl-accepting chemotaxis protein-1 (serine sensor receptor)
MNQFKISTRLAILIGTLSALLIAIGGVGLFGISRSNEALRSVYEDRTVPTGQIAEIQRLLLLNRLAIANTLVNASPDAITKNTAEVDRNMATIGKIWDAYMATHLTPDEEKLAKAFAVDRGELVKQGLLPTVKALRDNDIMAAQQMVIDQVNPLAEKVRLGIDALLKLQLDVAKAEYEQAVSRYHTIRAVAIAAVLLGVALAVVLGVTLVRGVVRSLDAAVRVANAVAEGDLTQSVAVEGRDEVAKVLQALAAMKDSLVRIVSQVRQSSDSIATGSAQIATGNADLSQRTEEQASNLQQTAASMEQLTSTVKQNADTAHQANQLASSASAAATQGGVVVGQVVGTMDEISASSKKISDIIGVIDGIAFQTNILALNAAVEAARAGEQGRGFAVVASEVRSLAQRSAEAAKEIKVLIGQSVEKVEAGSRLVGDAGKSMDDIVGQVKRVNDLIAEISAASIEQTQGISQVGDAVQQLDNVTQQNAALVEESAAAADSLKQQAASLAQVVGVFRIDPGASRAVEAPAPSAVPAAPAASPVAKSAAQPARATVLPAGRAAPIRERVAVAPKQALPPAPVRVADAASSDWESF